MATVISIPYCSNKLDRLFRLIIATLTKEQLILVLNKLDDLDPVAGNQQ